MEKLTLSKALLDRVERVYQLIKEELPESEVYLFGSYAKKKVKPSSDLDLLVLLDAELDKMTIKKMKWALEEKIEETIGYEYEVDLKIYTNTHFEKCKQTLGFEAAIAEYMISLEGHSWR